MAFCPTCASPIPDGAARCESCGSSLDSFPPLEGERKIATVLFADVVRSTAMAERLDPEDWAAIMNGAFGFMNGAVSQFGGTVAKLMGDAVMAYFGAPVAQEDHAERAVRAGLDMLAAGESYGRSLERRFDLDFRLRVGINTGTAVLARVGDAVKAEYTVMGDTTNVAARLQAAAEPGTVLISGETQRLVRGLFDVEARGPLQVRGRRAPVETYRVVAVGKALSATRGLEGLRAPLVGRERELAVLAERLADLAAGVGSIVAVVGEAGIGKSRLVAEVRQGAERQGTERRELAPAWFEGRAISYGQALAYHPWQQLGRQLIGVSPGEPPAAVRSRLAAFCDGMGVDREHLPLLERMLAVDPGGSPAGLEETDGEALTRRIADAVAACLRGSIHQGGGTLPHVLAFDDLHWSDPASLDLIAQLAPLVREEPLLVLCVLRPDRQTPSWALLDRLGSEASQSFVRLDLDPLDADRSAELLASLLRIEELPDPVRRMILDRSDGNPFFLEEVLRSLIDTGHVVREGDRWRATAEIAALTIPDTLAGVLSARIDRLPGGTKRTAQAAAVLGRIFAHRVLAQVCRAAPPPDRIDDVDPHLVTLSREELVRERARFPEREYGFKHALTQEAAYGLLLRHRRRDLHLQAGLALEGLYPEGLEELAPLLARHFHEGGDPQRALDYALKAASRAVGLSALREAAEHYEMAYRSAEVLETVPHGVVVDTILGWSVVRYKLTRYEGVAERLERAEQMAREAGDDVRLARVLSWISLIHMVRGFPSRGEPYLVESNELASRLGMDHLMLLPFFFATDALIDRDPGRAAEQFDQVVELARRNRMPEIEGHALASSSVALARLGEFERARERIEEALAAAPSGGHRVKEADVHIVVSGAYYEMGDYEKGLEHARRGAELAHAEQALECACVGYYSVGMGELERRELDQALRSFRTSFELADQVGLEMWGGYSATRARAGAAAAEYERGSSEGRRELEAALARARAEKDDYGAASLSETLGRALAERGDAAAVVHLESAVDYYRLAGMRPSEARALGRLSGAYERFGRDEEARTTRHREAELRASLRLAPAIGPGG